MNDLKIIIIEILKWYDEINDLWKKNNLLINMKKIQIADVYNKNILPYIFIYRNFINENTIKLIAWLQSKNNEKYNISSRVKALNSIQYKIENYILNHMNGKVPLKKSINDIFGIRIIFKEDINYNKVKKIIDEEFAGKLKCIEAKRENYYAVHIYFDNTNNQNFQWELQIWDRKHQKRNLISHSKYKQDYAKWEMENYKGGIK